MKVPLKYRTDSDDPQPKKIIKLSTERKKRKYPKRKYHHNESKGDISQIRYVHSEEIEHPKLLSEHNILDLSCKSSVSTLSKVNPQNYLSCLKEITKAELTFRKIVYWNSNLILALPCKFQKPNEIPSTTEQQFPLPVNDPFKLQRTSNNDAHYSAIIAAVLLFLACSLAIPVLIKKMLEIKGRILELNKA